MIITYYLNDSSRRGGSTRTYTISEAPPYTPSPSPSSNLTQIAEVWGAQAAEVHGQEALHVEHTLVSSELHHSQKRIELRSKDSMGPMRQHEGRVGRGLQ